MYNIVALFFQLILMCVRPRTSLSFSLSRMLSHTRTCTKTQTHALNNNNENCCVPNLALNVISVYTQSSQTSLQRHATKTNHYTAVTSKSTTAFWHSHKRNALKHCISQVRAYPRTLTLVMKMDEPEGATFFFFLRPVDVGLKVLRHRADTVKTNQGGCIGARTGEKDLKVCERNY